MVAGFMTSFVLGPLELIKCRIQLQGDRSVYKGPLDCLTKIYKNEGLRFGVFRGFMATFLREIPHYGS